MILSNDHIKEVSQGDSLCVIHFDKGAALHIDWKDAKFLWNALTTLIKTHDHPEWYTYGERLDAQRITRDVR